jgi:signal transduction histidine kinase
MKNLTIVPEPVQSAHKVTATPVPLHDLVNQLMNGLLPLVTGKKSFIINDVDRTFQLQTDENVLAFVVGNLLSGSVNSTENVCIRIEAILCEECVQIRVRNNGTYFYSTVAHSFSQVVEAARRLGGNISIYNQQNQGTTITFSIARQRIAC